MYKQKIILDFFIFFSFTKKNVCTGNKKKIFLSLLFTTQAIHCVSESSQSMSTGVVKSMIIPPSATLLHFSHDHCFILHPYKLYYQLVFAAIKQHFPSQIKIHLAVFSSTLTSSAFSEVRCGLFI